MPCDAGLTENRKASTKRKFSLNRFPARQKIILKLCSVISVYKLAVEITG